jgi:hypothetical protein
MCAAIKIEDYFTLDNISEVYDKRIRSKSGRGIDRTSVVDFDKDAEGHFEVIRRKCANSTYRFSPYLQRLILKGPKKFPRSISIPTVRDKIVLSILNSVLQDAFPDSVKRELPNVKVRNLAKALNKSNGARSLHRVDVEAYYDNIDHEQLFSELDSSELASEFLTLIRRAVRNPTVPEGYHREDRQNYANKDGKGVPQGLPISNVLAEIYLKDTDEVLEKLCFHYDRYVDDIVALTDPEVDFEGVCQSALKDKDLGLNTDKSDFCCKDECTIYLGYTLSGSDISVRQSTLEKHLRSISMMFVRLKKAIYIDGKRKDKQIGVENIKKAFLEDLNVKITGAKFQTKRYGWLQYFSEINDKNIPYLIDNFVRGQFKRCSVFPTIPDDLKKVSRAFYELKFNWWDSTYLHDYELSDFKDKRAWLTNRGLALGQFSKDEIDRLYAYHVGRFLNQIEKDMGVDYKI